MSRRPLSWPTPRRLATGLWGALGVSLVFFPVYLGCAAITAARGRYGHPYADWELTIPFVPFMVVPYLSIFGLFLLPPFQLEEAELRVLTARLVVASLLGGMLFLAFPARMGFLPRSALGKGFLVGLSKSPFFNPAPFVRFHINTPNKARAFSLPYGQLEHNPHYLGKVSGPNPWGPS